MKKNKNNFSIDGLEFTKKYEFYSTIIFAFISFGSIIAGLIMLKFDYGYSIGLLIVGLIFSPVVIASYCTYRKSKKLIEKIMDTLTEEQKESVSYLMSIDYRDYMGEE